jgi:hypothetical protein
MSRLKRVHAKLKAFELLGLSERNLQRWQTANKTLSLISLKSEQDQITATDFLSTIPCLAINHGFY